MKIRKHLPEILFGISAVLLILRGMMSFCWSDESLYFSTAYRLMMGDAPFVQEWYLTQLLSIMLIPLMWVKSIFGGMTGVILFFRIAYVCGTVVASYGIYRMLRRTCRGIWPLMAGLTLLFYAHLNIATFSYYMVSVYSALLSALLTVDSTQDGRMSKVKLILAGFFCATLVLSMPTMAAVYVVAVVLCLIIYRGKSLPFIGYSFLGILIPAIPFTIYVLMKSPVQEIITAAPYILSDEEHASTTLYVTARTCLNNLTNAYGKYFYLYLGGLLLAVGYVLIQFLLVRRSRESAKMLSILKVPVILMNLVGFAGMCASSVHRTGYILVALALFGLPLFLITEKKNWSLLVPYGLGMIMAYSYTYTSSGAPLYTEAIGFAVASVPAVIMIGDYGEELYRQQKKRSLGTISYACLVAICCAVLCIVIALRVASVYRDDRIMNLTVRITEGPAKGLYTSEKHFNDYNQVMESMKEINTLASEKGYQSILISKLLPFGYMCTDLSCAAPSSWRNSLDSPWLQSYYELHEDALPDLVFVLQEHFGSYETCGDVEADPNPNLNNMGDFMKEYLNEADFAVRQLPAGVLYYRR